MNVKVWNTKDLEFQQRQSTNKPALQQNVTNLEKVVVNPYSIKVVVNPYSIKGRELKLVQSGLHLCKRKIVSKYFGMNGMC